MQIAWLVLVVMMSYGATFATAPQAERELVGSWRATAGTRVLQGTWTATVNPKTPNVAHGSWSLIEANRMLLHGTWAAEKVRTGWRGTWSARVAGRAGSPPITGTWQADIKDLSLKTLADMLQHTAQAQVDGTWRRGRMAGTWSLVGSPK